MIDPATIDTISELFTTLATDDAFRIQYWADPEAMLDRTRIPQGKKQKILHGNLKQLRDEVGGEKGKPVLLGVIVT